MTKEELFESMEGIGPEILERSEKASAVDKKIWKRMLPLAACLGIVIVAVILLSKVSFWKPSWVNPTYNGESVPPVNGNWTVHYKDIGEIQGSVLYKSPDFSKDMNGEEMEAILPKNRPEWLQGTGASGFDKEGELKVITLKLRTTVKNATAKVKISDIKEYTRDFVITNDGVKSICNGIDFYAYECSSGKGKVNLVAVAWINNYWFSFSLAVWEENVDRAKENFKQILESFTYYGEPEKPMWSKVTCASVPESYNKNLTLEQGRADETFGAFLPQNTPDGFALASCNRYKNYASDYLQVYWKQDAASLRWTVTRYKPETDEPQMSSIEDIYRYMDKRGLIFDAADITKEFVTSTLKDRCSSRKGYTFCVRYNEYLIRLELVSFDVSWVWTQLAMLGVVADYNETVYVDRWINSLEEGRAEETFGSYLPMQVEYEMVLILRRLESNIRNFLELELIGEGRYLCLRISEAEENMQITSTKDINAYDLTPYTSPWDGEIPKEQKNTAVNPIFDSSALSLDVVERRIYYLDSDHYIPRMEFTVKYENVAIKVFASGFSADEVYALLAK